jgi:hypothetical protein
VGGDGAVWQFKASMLVLAKALVTASKSLLPPTHVITFIYNSGYGRALFFVGPTRNSADTRELDSSGEHNNRYSENLA